MYLIVEHFFENDRPWFVLLILPVNRVLYLHMQLVHFGDFDYPAQYGIMEVDFRHSTGGLLRRHNRGTLSRVKLRAQRLAEAKETPKLRPTENADASRRPAAAS